MENQQQPIDVELMVEAAWGNHIYKETYGDTDPNMVEISGKQEFIDQITRDLEKAGVKVVKR